MNHVVPAFPARRARAGDLLPALACRLLKQVASADRLRGRLSILIYHRVLARPDPLFPDEIDAQRFEQQLRYLKANFNLLPLCDAVEALRNGCLPPRSACLTFDDGYADNATIALPLLQKYEVPATIFVATGFLDGGRMWNDTIIELIRLAPDAIDLSSAGFGPFALDTVARRQHAIRTLLDALKYLPIEAREAQVEALAALVPVTLPADLMMSTEQLRQVHHAGIHIGGHTVNHPIIARLPDASARREIVDGKAALEAMIDAPVTLFAYPNGKPGTDYCAEHVRMVNEAGFTAAVSTSWGAARQGNDLFQLPRFTPWDRSQVRFTMRMLQNLRSRGETV
jgi:peptidoglycan/xylan/chitin deacetylase (PgdA/CDA1 family)